MADETTPDIYQLHVRIRQISPMIWRRLLVRSDSTLVALHDAIQIARGWTDSHRIHGRDHGVGRVGGPSFSGDARPVRLDSFLFRLKERLLYKYDFRDLWQHEVRIERRLTAKPRRTYPVCIGGRRHRRITAVLGRS